jgi:hypothetical protein
MSPESNYMESRLQKQRRAFCNTHIISHSAHGKSELPNLIKQMRTLQVRTIVCNVHCYEYVHVLARFPY